MTTKLEKLQNILAGLRQECEDIEASALVSIEGLMMAADVPQDVSKELVAAMSALLLSVGKRVTRELAQGLFSLIYISGDHAASIILEINAEVLLVVMIRPALNLESMLSKIGEAKTAIAKLI